MRASLQPITRNILMSQIQGNIKHKQGLNGCLRWAIGVLALLCILYLAYAIFLWVEFSNNYTMWLDQNATNYTVSVKYSKAESITYVEDRELVRNKVVVQGFQKFDKPIIDWAFEHAKNCITSWPLCKFFGWSFQYDPDYGYPTHIEYHDYDWLYIIDVNGFTKN
ncbi:MAG: hypothetical protein KF716_13485 [Anaerolineae bacterium]|nr:hypothetical protein [Anaerolineae bacterium]